MKQAVDPNFCDLQQESNIVFLLLQFSPLTHRNQIASQLDNLSGSYGKTLLNFRTIPYFKDIGQVRRTMQPGPIAYGTHFKRDSRDYLSLHAHIAFAIHPNHDHRFVLELANQYFRSRHPRSNIFSGSQPEDLVFDCKPSTSPIISTNLASIEDFKNNNDVLGKMIYDFDFCNAKNYTQYWTSENFDIEVDEAADRFALDLLEIDKTRKIVAEKFGGSKSLFKKSRHKLKLSAIAHQIPSITRNRGVYRLQDDGSFVMLSRT